MTDSPLKSFGFNYEYAGRKFALDLLAESEEEAKSRVAAMSTAVCLGELRLAESKAPDTSTACR